MDEKLTSGNKGVSRGKVRIFMRRWRGSWGWIGDAMIREWLDELWGCGDVRTKDRGLDGICISIDWKRAYKLYDRMSLTVIFKWRSRWCLRIECKPDLE